jgi:D-glycero-alpha-D-manno-heptose 1-phosphate guanylyltransferase
MKLKTAIILAGGLGTRLRSAVPDLPKCMAPVAGRPFLAHVIEYYLKEGIETFVLSLGYKHEIIGEFISEQYADKDIRIVIENEPLGTGGAILNALTATKDEHVLILNGDTLFKVDTDVLFQFHLAQKDACTLALKPMEDFERYGVVELNEDATIRSFQEKKQYAHGLINGGVYILERTSFLRLHLPIKFSFEKEYLEPYYPKQKMSGSIQDRYFIDIGIPEDFTKAQSELS